MLAREDRNAAELLCMYGATTCLWTALCVLLHPFKPEDFPIYLLGLISKQPSASSHASKQNEHPTLCGSVEYYQSVAN